MKNRYLKTFLKEYKNNIISIYSFKKEKIINKNNINTIFNNKNLKYSFLYDYKNNILTIDLYNKSDNKILYSIDLKHNNLNLLYNTFKNKDLLKNSTVIFYNKKDLIIC